MPPAGSTGPPSSRRSRPARRPTWAVFTSDHGEALGEHGRTNHTSLDQGVLAIPLVIVPPASVSRAPRTIERQVRQIARARDAVARLRTGEAIADVAYELGYADQSHLTRDVKRLTGYTPAESQRRDEPV